MEDYIKSYLIYVTIIMGIAMYFTSSGAVIFDDPKLNLTCDARFDLNGQHFNEFGHILTLGSDCIGQTSNDFCGYEFEWSAPHEDEIKINFLKSSHQKGCAQDLGPQICIFREGIFDDSFSYVQIICDDAVLRFFRRR